MEVSLFSPAKINLFLAVTGRRADGFHDLLSVVAPLDFGDQLVAISRDDDSTGGFTLECDHPGVPVDGTNLVLRAAEAFALTTGWRQPVHFRLTKHIPPGAGLGGGSSNAVAALRALNRLAGDLLGEEPLQELGATLGSDCVLFLANAPVVMRGRGERCTVLPASAAARLRGCRVLLFKPSFGVGTPWAYGCMVARGTDYLPESEAENRLSRWVDGSGSPAGLLYNGFEPVVGEKYVALPLLCERLHREFGRVALMSGSGSACFLLLEPADDNEIVARMKQTIGNCWGSRTFIEDARLI